MAPSQLKQLKANLHARRNAKGPNTADKPQHGNKVDQRKPPKRRLDPKAHADSLRRTTLLPALQNRHKVGGIVDRRIGENDPTMSPEERMLQRYARQRTKRGDAFNLEDDEGEDGLLTHGGRGLFDGDMEDSAEGDLGEDGEDTTFLHAAKRGRSDVEGDGAVDEDAGPERKKSKKEVMEEVIAKSKFHKYERQKVKDEDEDVRDELDKGLPDLLSLLRGAPRMAPKIDGPVTGLAMHPDRAAQLSESAEEKAARAAKEYDKRLRLMASDQRAQPVDRTKTEEEKAADEALRLQQLEAGRLRRMKGEPADSESEQEDEEEEVVEEEDVEDDAEVNEVSDFGFKDTASAPQKSKTSDGIEDEDDFIIDEDLVASASDIDTDFSGDSEDGEGDDEIADNDDDQDFLKDVLPTSANAVEVSSGPPKLAYTFPCPESHDQLLDVLKGVALEDLPTVIQRIRSLYHPQLNAQNKEKLSKFAGVLVDHLAYLGSLKPPLAIVEMLIRHIHSLSKSHSEATSSSFRAQLLRIQQSGQLTPGDLFILTAIGSIFPASDHFHQVVTPAITIMSRWLGMTAPRTLEISRTGAYVVALCIKYQHLSKRYIPEAVRFTTAIIKQDPTSPLVGLHVRNLSALADLWSSKSAFFEIFYPSAYKALKKTKDGRAIRHLRIALSQSIARRRPLELHHHRPLPIKSTVPKFEEGFNPNKHYDPDRERAEANKLRKEYKREHKGAVRELRKDAAFMHRESLKEKKARDAAYEQKQRRLIAEIQGEEGREANEYEREKRKRKGRK